MARTTKAAAPLTTAHRLGSLVKSCRDIMRKDKGLNGDLDRLPQLTWMMFLKFLDDLEQQDETRAVLASQPYVPLIPAPYRWRDWAARADGITGHELMAFVNNDEAVLPDGSRGPGLFAKLRSLEGAEGGDRRDVVARVFAGTTNRMLNGYLVRDVLNKLDEIHFTSTDELHTLSALYEGMLREMRDAAGDSGEFYTPRAVVKLMVAVTDPRLGETVLDPACGTGGFLVEAYEHLAKQVDTAEDRDQLQRRTLHGGEAKSLPYLLAEMNLLLHGVEVPNVAYGNSLAVKLTELGDRDRVDVVLTNPPFGGEEEAGIKANFPADKQTSETALLFLQLIMRKLRRPGHQGKPGGRAAVVVPNGILFGDGVCARVKEQLLTEFNLHTVVRLPNGVFAPYTQIPTNLLFFDRSGPTDEIWYYEHPTPEGRKSYSKTKALQPEELEPLLAWWSSREENERAWRVKASEVLEYNGDGVVTACNLDRKNPRTTEDLETRSPEELVESIIERERRVLELLDEVRVVATGIGWRLVPLRTILRQRPVDVRAHPTENYRFAGIKSFGAGVFRSGERMGSEFSYQFLTRLIKDDLVYGKLMAWEGGIGIVPGECDGCLVSPEFPVFEIDREAALPEFIGYYFQTPSSWNQLAKVSTGTNVRRRRVHPSRFLEMRIPLPPLSEQLDLVQRMDLVSRLRSLIASQLTRADKLIQVSLETAFNEHGASF